jgi:hypothetical protein
MSRYGAVVAAFLLAGNSAWGQTPALTIGVNFGGATLNSEPPLNAGNAFFFPPDTQGAVGPNHYVEQVNGESRMYTKDGTLVGTAQSLESFWTVRAGQSALSGSFDPRIQYDANSGRWYAVVNDRGGSANSTYVAVSPGSDPTAASWPGFRFALDSTNTQWGDYPTLGISKNWLAVSNNMFPITTGSQNVSLLTIPISSLVAGNSTGSKYQPGLNPNDFGFTAHPVTDMAATSATAYTLSDFNTPSGFMESGTITGTVQGVP